MYCQPIVICLGLFDFITRLTFANSFARSLVPPRYTLHELMAHPAPGPPAHHADLFDLLSAATGIQKDQQFPPLFRRQPHIFIESITSAKSAPARNLFAHRGSGNTEAGESGEERKNEFPTSSGGGGESTTVKVQRSNYTTTGNP